MILCKYGCGRPAEFQFKDGTWACTSIFGRCPVGRNRYSKSIKIRYKNGTMVSGFIAFNKTHPKEKGVFHHTEETKLKLRGRTRKMSDEFRERRREEMLERYSKGWECRCGRAKKYDYISKSAGKIKVDGTWELKVAEYLDSLNINWTRNKKRFEYFNSIKEKKSTYCPDFFVEDWNTFIEVKGYKTKLDEIKWSQFNFNLQIWDYKKLKELNLLNGG
jgi:hypothetical protein